MRKILFVILFFVATIANAQCYTKFKGIEIKGTIEEFGAKLEKQGFTFVKNNPGVFGYTGKYWGEEVTIVVFYTVKTRTTYSVNVIFHDKDTREYIEIRYNKLLELLTQKYGEPAEKNVPFDAGGEYLGEICSRWKDECGGITLKKTHVAMSKYHNEDVVILTYWSAEGYDLNDAELLEEL